MPVSAAPIRLDDFSGKSFSNHTRTNVALALVLILLTGWAFLPVLHNGFVNFDDGEYVVGNAHVKAGLTWDGVRWAFGSTVGGNWHPVTWLSHMLDCELFGLKPWGHHLTNLALHAANVVLVFWVFSRMTGSVWRSFFVAAAFGVHPLRVESVAWASERKDVLSLLFWMLTLWSYWRYVTESGGLVTKSEIRSQKSEEGEHEPARIDVGVPNQKSKIKNQKSLLFYLLSLAFFLTGLMSKPSLVTLPFVLLLLDYWPLRRGASSRLVIEKVPYVVLALGMSLVAFFVQQHEGAVASMSHIPVGLRLENAAVSYVRYLGKVIWPVNLSVYYSLPASWPIGTVALSVLLLAGISLGVIALSKQWPFLLVGWFWFVGTLVPMIGLVQVGEQAMADRYTYISSLGVLIMLAWSVPEITGGLRFGLLSGATALILIMLCVVTRQQAGYWKSSETLFRHALAVSPDSYGARVNLGNALFAEGRLDDAISEFQQAVRLRPELRLPHSQLAAALRAKGRSDEAVEQFGEILKLNPNDAGAHNEIGAILFDQGHLDEAINQYREAAKLDPNAAATHYNWGIALSYQGHFDEAAAQLKQAAELDPGNARARYNLGVALSSAGHVDDAIREFRAALSLDPNAPKAHYQLGLALAKTGRAKEAIAELRAALTLQPNYAEAAQALTKLTERP